MILIGRTRFLPMISCVASCPLQASTMTSSGAAPRDRLKDRARAVLDTACLRRVFHSGRDLLDDGHCGSSLRGLSLVTTTPVRHLFRRWRPSADAWLHRDRRRSRTCRSVRRLARPPSGAALQVFFPARRACVRSRSRRAVRRSASGRRGAACGRSPIRASRVRRGRHRTDMLSGEQRAEYAEQGLLTLNAPSVCTSTSALPQSDVLRWNARCRWPSRATFDASSDASACGAALLRGIETVSDRACRLRACQQTATRRVVAIDHGRTQFRPR